MEELPQQAPADPLLGAVLDQRYRIERKLGQGGMGMVYLGEHLRTGRKCAVKLLPPEAAQDPEAVKRFDREARVLGALGHPGIVGIHDFSETGDGRPYIVMDYLEGEDLQTRLRRVGRLSWDEARKIIDEISAALYAAHQAGVLHRDLKPANVFLTRSPGAPERVVLLDFGLAKGGVSESVALTHSNMVMGTPLYMSPEQARGVAVDGRSDIYSLAALTYELLAGQPPFVGPNYTAVLASLLTDPPRKLSESSPGVVPSHLDLTLDVALSKSPESRQPDVAAFATAVLQQRPRWIDTTAQRVAVAAPTALASAATVASSPEMTAPSALASAATVASSPEMTAPSALASAATVASNPEMTAPSALASAATVASVAPQSPVAAQVPPSAVQSPIGVQPAPSVVQSPVTAVSPPSLAESDLAVQHISAPLSPSSVEASPPGSRRTALLPVVLILVALGTVGAGVAYWLGQRRGGAGSSTGDAPQAAASLATGDAAISAPPRVADARVASPDAAIKQQNTEKPPRRMVSGGTARRPPARPRARATARARPRPRPRRRATPRPAPRRPAMRRISNVRLGDLYIKGRYRECLKQARYRPRTKSNLEYGYYCANKLRNTRAVKRFCRQYLRLNRSDGHSNTCRRILKR